jgi:plasmid stabilization system protein ParE
MVHQVGARARADLDEIWIYIVRESGSEAIADRLTDSITSRFYPLSSHPQIGRARDDDLGRGRQSFSVGAYIIV